MSLKTTIVIIALIAIVSLVGVGFATWTFTEPANSVDIDNVTGKVAAAIKAESVEVTKLDGTTAVTALYIICKSQSEGGVFWSTTADGSDKITQIKLTGSVEEEDNDFLDFSTYTGTFTISCDGATGGDWLEVAAINENHDVPSSGKNTDVFYTYTLPGLSYAAVPSGVDEVAALRSEVNAFDLTITFGFYVKDVA